MSKDTRFTQPDSDGRKLLEDAMQKGAARPADRYNSVTTNDNDVVDFNYALTGPMEPKVEDLVKDHAA